MKIGLIGYGSFGRKHAKVLTSLPGIELHSIANDIPVDPADLPEGVNFVTDYRELLDAGIDAVVVVVPTVFHYEVARAAIERGIPTLIEKPVTQTMDEGLKLLALAEKKNVVVRVGHIERFNPVAQRLKAELDSGRCGEMYRFDAGRVFPYNGRILDVGIALDLSIHDVDLLLWISGRKPARVTAERRRSIHPFHEDHVEALIRFNDAVFGHVLTSWTLPRRGRWVRAEGSLGSLQGDLSSNEVRFTPTDGEPELIPVEPTNQLAAEHLAFVEAVKGNPAPGTTLEESLLALGLVLQLAHAPLG
jgi:predicted dehydrogenase